jgi:hypothetical protein
LVERLVETPYDEQDQTKQWSDTMKVIRTDELHKGDVYRLPEDVAELHVRSGKAWITMPQEDILLSTGEFALFFPDDHDIVLSSLGDKPLVVEELG